MRTIAHLSDLHFGRVDPAVVGPLLDAVAKAGPDAVAVSGDLTQRARGAQFREAREFLDSLPAVPQIVVPGNHDVPLWNAFKRFARPLAGFRRYISEDVEPFYSDDEIAILGVNTARSFTTKYGRINERQIGRLRERMCAYGDHVTKVVVTHHPFDLPEGYDEAELVGRASMAMETLAACGADLLLAGHLHVGHTAQTAKRYEIEGHSALVVQAGTAASSRVRGEPNSFNLIRVKRPHVNVVRYAFDADRRAFAPASSEHFQHTPAGWQRLSDESAAGLTYDDKSDALQPHVPDAGPRG
ncbi:MAG: metallophosphoesterase [Acidobacteriota bacterium]|nr:metallophosphoesterase [Acidobacteriota bacterium]